MWKAAAGATEFTAFQSPRAISPKLYLFRSLSPATVPRGEGAFAGLTLRADCLGGQLLPAAAAEALRGSDLSVAVSDEGQSEIWTSGPRARRP